MRPWSQVDGFYDVLGDFPEVEDSAGGFPKLEELKKVRTAEGDLREAVVIDHSEDSNLCAFEERAADVSAEVVSQGPAARIKALAQIVVDSMGGTRPARLKRQRKAAFLHGTAGHNKDACAVGQQQRLHGERCFASSSGATQQPSCQGAGAVLPVHEHHVRTGIETEGAEGVVPSSQPGIHVC
ncbi:protein kinase domain-containing protein [Haematococcus lacustris]|uniref:Protein kinase domain-containing protein n=1 Tax=Haematococcus lacustris TaxID=44745 RepID=A0A6A0AMD9_HAELA|nr:protein kinase domain-containing protein [Haematococcus lacustris]